MPGPLRHLIERPWLPTVVNIARRYRAPIVPLHIRAHNSAMFYALSLISQELRDITLFNELLNKRRQPFALSFGAPVDQGDTSAATQVLRTLVERDLRPRRIDAIRPYLRYLTHVPA